ncbi:MAG: hypothetical protein H0T84_13975, partial [Tatlockia sp.]|nr:hypothetical protein [Tatlockia sp.]
MIFDYFPSVKPKKIPYYLLLFLLTLGASAIIGFLSFTGMYALFPIIALAYVSFGLSIAYEGEIFLQNIKGAINKLFKANYLKNQLANDYLLKQFNKDAIDTEADDCPQFFKDYRAQLELLHKFSHKRLDKESEAKKKQMEKTLKDMEGWFSLQLFAVQEDAQKLTAYEIQVRNWLKDHKQEKRKELYTNRQYDYRLVLGFSVLAGIFMGLGNTYLLIGAFTTISIASPPALIIVMSIIAGAAYMLQIYNAVTDMIHNDTIRLWYSKIRRELTGELSPRSVFIAVTAITLFTLAVLLTLCSAGTWWTIIQKTPPLFSWMSKVSSNILGFLIPLIVGGAQLLFNLQNTTESLGLIDEATKVEGGFFKTLWEGLVKAYDHWMANENWLQKLNPFRFLLKVIITPLRLILFLGHLIAIGVTADEVPGVSEIATALLGFVCEFGEDLHYFAGDLFHTDHGHHHGIKDLLKERFKGHGHDHSDDIPTKILRFVFIPLYAAAAAWDYMATRIVNSGKSLSLVDAWEKQRGIPSEESVEIEPTAKKPSKYWQIAQPVYNISKQVENLKKATIDPVLAQKKVDSFEILGNDLRNMEGEDEAVIKNRI